MPEIAEVEIQRLGIEKHFCGQVLQSLELDDRFGAHRLADRFAGQKLYAVLRHGKLLGLEFDRDMLAVHLRMTGGFYLEEKPHTRARFLFDETLFFADPRHFATIEYAPSWPPDALGPDLWNLVPGWKPPERFSSSRRAVKAVVLDQRVLAGIGNYLADESLWAARVRPDRPAYAVTDEEWHDIVKRAQELSGEVLRRGGVSLRDYQNLLGEDGRGGDLLRVYGKSGQDCRRCGKTLQKTKVGGRGTSWCSCCQV